MQRNSELAPLSWLQRDLVALLGVKHVQRAIRDVVAGRVDLRQVRRIFDMPGQLPYDARASFSREAQARSSGFCVLAAWESAG